MVARPDTLPPAVVAALRTELPRVAEQTVAAIVVEVPGYADAFAAGMGRTIEGAVQLALGGFLELATSPDAGAPVPPAVDGAYALGQGEARTGRSMDALLAAYRVGARVAWRELAATAVGAGLTVAAMARFAELVFEFIDRLSAASASGHAAELASNSRVRQRHLERLAALLVAGAPADDLTAAAERADWPAPRTLTALVLPEQRVRGALIRLPAGSLVVPDGGPAGQAGLLVPDAGGDGRAALLRALEGSSAVVGPSRAWQQVGASWARVLRAVRLGLTDGGDGPVDTETRLVELVVQADPEALADLRARVLAPLADLAPEPREKLTATLRAWLLHHGRRERAAAELFVHPQTVRYRMGQVRELFGDRLEDPGTLLQLTVALGAVDRRPRPSHSGPADVTPATRR